MSVNIAALPQEVRDVLENSFDKDFYLRSNPDVAKSQVAPFEHFINYGLNESRPWQVLSVAGQGKTIDLFETSKADFMSLLTETLKVSEQAKKKGALGIFDKKYGDIVSVYTIEDFSSEICAGPHIENTCELGHFKIKKETSSSAGVRRIKAVLE